MRETLKKIYHYFDDDKRIVKLQKKAKYFSKKNKYISNYFVHKCLRKYRCCFAANANIGDNLLLPHPLGIVVGEGVIIGKNVTIYQNVTLGQNNGKYPVIGDNVVIYAGAVIIGDITIGNDVIIGANSVVKDSINDGCIVAGVPAKVIKEKRKQYE